MTDTVCGKTLRGYGTCVRSAEHEHGTPTEALHEDANGYLFRTAEELAQANAEVPAEHETQTFTFDAVHLPKFAAGMAELAKVARKLGVPEMTYTETARETRQFVETRLSGTPIPYEVTYVTVSVQGTTPVLTGGWQYLGTIEHLPNGNLVHGTDEALATFRNAQANCVHCGMSRNRKSTVIVRDEHGNVAQVGTSCLKDFLGYHGNAERLVSLLDAYEELRTSAGNYGNGSADGIPTDTFFAVVCACVRSNGWVPKSAYDGTPTATLAAYVLRVYEAPSKDEYLRALIASVQVTEADVNEASKVRAFCADIPADTTDNYLGNVRVACTGEYVQPKHFGIAASAVSARRKAEVRDAERAEADGKRAQSVHVGTVGQRLTLTVKVDFVRSFENAYGTSYLVEMTDEHGNVLKTFASGAFGRDAERGDVATIKGTVKEHETYVTSTGNVRHSTMLTRIAVVEWHETETSADNA